VREVVSSHDFSFEPFSGEWKGFRSFLGYFARAHCEESSVGRGGLGSSEAELVSIGDVSARSDLVSCESVA